MIYNLYFSSARLILNRLDHRMRINGSQWTGRLKIDTNLTSCGCDIRPSFARYSNISEFLIQLIQEILLYILLKSIIKNVIINE